MDCTNVDAYRCSVPAQEVFREKSLIQGYDAVIDCARRLVNCLCAFSIPRTDQECALFCASKGQASLFMTGERSSSIRGTGLCYRAVSSALGQHSPRD